MVASKNCREFTIDEVTECVARLKNRKAEAVDETVNKFPKYKGRGLISTMVLLYMRIWENDDTPRRWREGVMANLFKKEDNANPRDYRGIPLLSTA